MRRKNNIKYAKVPAFISCTYYNDAVTATSTWTDQQGLTQS